MSSGAMFYSYYLNWHRPARSAYMEGLNMRPPSTYYSTNKILFCGMGGSGIAGMYAAHILEAIGYQGQLKSITGMKLPAWVDRKTLVFAISFSGNTVETLRCAEASLRNDAKVILVSRGGAMEDMAAKRGIPFIRVPEAPAPRAGLPGLLFSILGILTDLGVLEP
jgi:glucose/mannose-6-phosphate isomerase